MDNISRKQLVWLAILFEGGLGLLALLIGWIAGNSPWELISWDEEGLALGIAATIPMLVLFAICLRWPRGPLSSIKKITDQVIRPLFQECTVFELAVIGLLAGFGEEMLFRGLIQTASARHFGPWLGLALASFLFGLVHPITLTYVGLATLLGAYLGWLFLVTANLLVVIIAHGLYDFAALLYLVRFRNYASSDSPESLSLSSSPTPDS